MPRHYSDDTLESSTIALLVVMPVALNFHHLLQPTSESLYRIGDAYHVAVLKLYNHAFKCAEWE